MKQYKIHKQYRLPGYDYADHGNYFVTICTKNRHKQFFGKINGGTMNLSSLGNIVVEIWESIPKIFQGYLIDDYQVMPDHFHGIIRNQNVQRGNLINQSGNLINQIPTFKSGIINNPMELKEKSLGYIIRWFKGKVKFEANKISPGFRWQSRYYERIIRNDIEYYFIQEYIINNPANYNPESETEFEEKELTKQLENLKKSKL